MYFVGGTVGTHTFDQSLGPSRPLVPIAIVILSHAPTLPLGLYFLFELIPTYVGFRLAGLPFCPDLGPLLRLLAVLNH